MGSEKGGGGGEGKAGRERECVLAWVVLSKQGQHVLLCFLPLFFFF